MGYVIVVYGFLDAEGNEDEFITLDMDVAFNRAVRCDLTVISRRYQYVSSRVLADELEALDDAMEAERGET